MNDNPMINELGDPDMTPEKTAQAHAELNEKFGPRTMTGPPVLREGTEEDLGQRFPSYPKPAHDASDEPHIDTHATDPDVPAMLYNAWRTARIHESGGTWIGKPWAELGERKRKRFTRMVELFAESVGWDQ